MIELGTPVDMVCDVNGCTARQVARLVLLASGGFGAKPQTPGWQVGKRQDSGVFVVRCPAHQVVIAPPVIPDATDATVVPQ